MNIIKQLFCKHDYKFVRNKACEWLENYFKGVSSGTVYLEDFKKAIKE